VATGGAPGPPSAVVPDARAAARAEIAAIPQSLRLRPGGSAVLTLRNLGARRVRVRLAASGLRVARTTVGIAAGSERRVRIGTPRDARPGVRTMAVRAGATRLRVAAFVPGPAPAALLGAPRLVREDGRVEGVRFTAGRVGRREGRPAVEPIGMLVLRLTGPEQRDLTPPGGSRDLLPGEYAYTLTDEVLGGLPDGRYRFVVRARGPAGGRLVTRRSESFPLR
jgi:hypothetical protein